jgi:hypothetical protein
LKGHFCPCGFVREPDSREEWPDRSLKEGVRFFALYNGDSGGPGGPLAISPFLLFHPCTATVFVQFCSNFCTYLLDN